MTSVIAIIATVSNPSYASVASALLISTVVYIIISAAPTAFFSTLFWSRDTQLLGGTSGRKIVLVSTAQILLLLITFYVSRTGLGLLFSLAACSMVYLSYFLLTIKNSGGLRLLLAKARGRLFFALMLYLGLVPLVYAHSHAMIESVYFASALSYIFATAVSSTNISMADSDILSPKGLTSANSARACSVESGLEDIGRPGGDSEVSARSGPRCPTSQV